MEKRFQYSKILPIFTGLLFAYTVVYSLTFGDFSQIKDSVIYCTAITVVGGVFGAVTTGYLKKSGTENIFKLKEHSYTTVSKVQIDYATSMMELQDKYKVSKEEIDSLNYESKLDEMKDESFNDIQNTLNSAIADAESEVTIQNYNY